MGWVTTLYPPGSATRVGAQMLLDGEIPQISYTSNDRSRVFYVQGGCSPIAPGIEGQDGLVLQSQSAPTAPFKHVDSQGAREDGVTWNDTVYAAMEWDMTLSAHSYTAGGLGRVVSDWIACWSYPQGPGRWEYYTPELGLWWANTRLNQKWNDHLKSEPRLRKQRIFTHSSRIDHAFWYGVDSVCTFAPGGSGGTGHLLLSNMGQLPGWPSIIFTGPGSIEVGNGPGSTSMIKFGPLLTGQRVLITTLPRLRSVVDLTTTSTTQQLDAQQQLIDTLIKLVTFNQVPPLLTWFESLFGIRPPQGVLYSLLQGRFSRPIPGVMQPWESTTSAIAVKITGGNSDSKVIASVTPRRIWPE